MNPLVPLAIVAIIVIGFWVVYLGLIEPWLAKRRKPEVVEEVDDFTEWKPPAEITLIKNLGSPPKDTLPPEKDVDQGRVAEAVARAEKEWLLVQKADLESPDAYIRERAHEALTNPRILHERRRFWRGQAIRGEQKSMANDVAIQAFIEPRQVGPVEKPYEVAKPEYVAYVPTEEDRIIEAAATADLIQDAVDQSLTVEPAAECEVSEEIKADIQAGLDDSITTPVQDSPAFESSPVHEYLDTGSSDSGSCDAGDTGGMGGD